MFLIANVDEIPIAHFKTFVDDFTFLLGFGWCVRAPGFPGEEFVPGLMVDGSCQVLIVAGEALVIPLKSASTWQAVAHILQPIVKVQNVQVAFKFRFVLQLKIL